MKTIAIFGSTSGIAEAYARLAAKAGDRLILIARSAEKMQIQKADLLARGAAQVDTLVLNFLDYASHATFMEQLFAERMDVVLMAQGCMYDQADAEKDFSKAKEMMDLNLISVMSLCNLMIPHLEAQAGGQLAIISSVAGDRGRASNAIYGASKAGVQALISGLRGRLFPFNVSVLDIRPGYVATAMTAHLKKGPLTAQPEVVAKGIERALRRRCSVVYLPWFWFVIMTIIKTLPEPIFKRLKI